MLYKVNYFAYFYNVKKAHSYHPRAFSNTKIKGMKLGNNALWCCCVNK